MSNKSVEPTPPPFAIRLFFNFFECLIIALLFYLPNGFAHLRRSRRLRLRERARAVAIDDSAAAGGSNHQWSCRTAA